GRDGELLLLGQGKLDGLAQPVPELGVLPAEGLVLPDQFVSGGPTIVLGLDGGQDLLGMVVDALTAATVPLSLLSDPTRGTGEPSSGMGDPANKRYGAHGDGSSGVRVRTTTAPMRSILPRIKRVLAEACQVST